MRADPADDLFTALGEDVATVAAGLGDDEPHNDHSADETDQHAEHESEHGTSVTHGTGVTRQDAPGRGSV